MALRIINAIETVPQFTTGLSTYQFIPGISISVKPNSTFYADLRFFLVQTGASSGVKLRVNGWTDATGPNPSFLTWTLNNIPDNVLYENAFPADPHEWVMPSISLRGEVHVFGLVRNDDNIDKNFTLEAATKFPFGNDLFIQGARLTIFQINGNHNSSFSNMTNCGCCLTAQISCCQDSLTINTISPSTDFKWKITDGLGAIYTGTVSTDSSGVGVITIGDGMDLPDGFIDAPKQSFRLEFIEAQPKIATLVSCIDVDVVSGAYLAIQNIGEPLP